MATRNPPPGRPSVVRTPRADRMSGEALHVHDDDDDAGSVGSDARMAAGVAARGAGVASPTPSDAGTIPEGLASVVVGRLAHFRPRSQLVRRLAVRQVFEQHQAELAAPPPPPPPSEGDTDGGGVASPLPSSEGVKPTVLQYAHALLRDASQDYLLWGNVVFVLASVGYVFTDFARAYMHDHATATHAMFIVFALAFVVDAVLYLFTWQGAAPPPTHCAQLADYTNIVGSIIYLVTSIMYMFEASDTVLNAVIGLETVATIVFVISACAFLYDWLSGMPRGSEPQRGCTIRDVDMWGHVFNILASLVYVCASLGTIWFQVDHVQKSTVVFGQVQGDPGDGVITVNEAAALKFMSRITSIGDVLYLVSSIFCLWGWHRDLGEALADFRQAAEEYHRQQRAAVVEDEDGGPHKAGGLAKRGDAMVETVDGEVVGGHGRATANPPTIADLLITPSRLRAPSKPQHTCSEPELLPTVPLLLGEVEVPLAPLMPLPTRGVVVTVSPPGAVSGAHPAHEGGTDGLPAPPRRQGIDFGYQPEDFDVDDLEGYQVCGPCFACGNAVGLLCCTVARQACWCCTGRIPPPHRGGTSVQDCDGETFLLYQPTRNGVGRAAWEHDHGLMKDEAPRMMASIPTGGACAPSPPSPPATRSTLPPATGAGSRRERSMELAASPPSMTDPRLVAGLVVEGSGTTPIPPRVPTSTTSRPLPVRRQQSDTLAVLLSRGGAGSKGE